MAPATLSKVLTLSSWAPVLRGRYWTGTEHTSYQLHCLNPAPAATVSRLDCSSSLLAGLPASTFLPQQPALNRAARVIVLRYIGSCHPLLEPSSGSLSFSELKS